MNADPVVARWHASIIQDAESTLGRILTSAERFFITSRGGMLALETIEDHVRSLKDDATELERYLNSEKS